MALPLRGSLTFCARAVARKERSVFRGAQRIPWSGCHTDGVDPPRNALRSFRATVMVTHQTPTLPACAVRYAEASSRDDALEYAEQVLASYDENAHRYIGDVTNIDPKSAVCCWGTFAQWALGYPERALKWVAMNDEHSRRRGHVFNLGFVLTGAGIVLDVLRDPHRMNTRAEEAEQLGRAHSVPSISETLAQVLKGVAWIRSGNLNEGIPRLRSAIETWSRYGNALWTPYLRSILAEG